MSVDWASARFPRTASTLTLGQRCGDPRLAGAKLGEAGDGLAQVLAGEGGAAVGELGLVVVRHDASFRGAGPGHPTCARKARHPWRNNTWVYDKEEGGQGRRAAVTALYGQVGRPRTSTTSSREPCFDASIRVPFDWPTDSAFTRAGYARPLAGPDCLRDGGADARKPDDGINSPCPRGLVAFGGTQGAGDTYRELRGPVPMDDYHAKSRDYLDLVVPVLLSRPLTEQQVRSAHWNPRSPLPSSPAELLELCGGHYKAGWADLAVRIAVEDLGEALPDPRWKVHSTARWHWRTVCAVWRDHRAQQPDQRPQRVPAEVCRVVGAMREDAGSHGCAVWRGRQQGGEHGCPGAESNPQFAVMCATSNYSSCSSDFPEFDCEQCCIDSAFQE